MDARRLGEIGTHRADRRLIQETATRFSRRCPAHYGAIRPIAVCTKRPMAARRGNKSSKARIFRPAAPTSRSIRAIPTSCSRRCGISGAKAGTFRSGGDSPDGAFSQWIVPFDRWRQHLDGDYARSQQRFSKETVWPFGGGDRAIEIATRLRVCRIDRRARSSFPMTAARHGTSATKASGWSGVRSTSRT